MRSNPILILFALVLLGCDSEVQRIEQVDAELLEWDVDGDRKINRYEHAGGANSGVPFGKCDSNADGYIDTTEWRAWVQPNNHSIFGSSNRPLRLFGLPWSWVVLLSALAVGMLWVALTQIRRNIGQLDAGLRPGLRFPKTALATVVAAGLLILWGGRQPLVGVPLKCFGYLAVAIVMPLEVIHCWREYRRGKIRLVAASPTAKVLPSGRRTYRSSGRVSWGLFGISSLAALVASGLIGGLLYLAYLAGIYLYFIAPVAAGCLCLLVLAFAVHFGKCRNKYASGVLGLLGGLTIFVGFYQMALIDYHGPQYILRFDAIPQQIAWQMRSEAFNLVPGAKVAHGAAVPIANWMLLVLEVVIACALTTCISFSVLSRNVFCERSNRWATGLIAAVPVDAEAELRAGVRHDSLSQTLANLSGIPITHVSLAARMAPSLLMRRLPGKPGGRLLLEYFYDNRTLQITSAYLSFMKFPEPGSIDLKETMPDDLRHLELTPEEFEAARHLFPKLPENIPLAALEPWK